MRRLRIVAIGLAMAVAAAGCGGGGGGEDEEDIDAPAGQSAVTTVPIPSTAGGTTLPATDLTLRITDVRLANSQDSDTGMRILLPAGVATASVTLTGLPSPNRVISVCQARELDRRQEAATCRTPASGEVVPVTLGARASGVEIVQVGTAEGPAGNSATVEEVTIRYAASSRELSVRLPQIAAESGGRPAFALTPAGADGRYRATLSWTVIPVFGGTGGIGLLELLQGASVSNQAQSSGEVRLEGNAPTSGEGTAIRVQNIGTASLVTPKLTLLLP